MVFPINRDKLLAAVANRLGADGKSSNPIGADESAQIATLIRRAVNADKDSRDGKVQSWREEVNDDRRFEDRLKAISQSTRADVAVMPPPGADGLTAYLRMKAGLANVAAVDVRPLTNGNSKQTFVFDMIESDRVTPLILRRDMKESFVDTSVMQEFDVIKALFDAGFPVPEPLWVEDAAASIEGCFLISRRIPGEVLGDSSQGAKKIPGKDPVVLLAQIFAQLHRIPVDKLALPVSMRSDQSGSPLQALIDQWRNLYRRQVAELSPLIEAGFDWLAARVPNLTQSALIHGDAGFHNIMIDDSGTTTLIDWELAHIGDPAEDLSGCRPYVEREGASFEQFLAHYEAAGGPALTPERLHYYEMFRLVRDCSILESGMELFNQGRSVDLVRMNNIHIVYSMLLSRLGTVMEQA